jgi:hypothetical protein
MLGVSHTLNVVKSSGFHTHLGKITSPSGVGFQELRLELVNFRSERGPDDCSCATILGVSHTPYLFGVSHTRIGVSHTKLRGFTHKTSGFHTQRLRDFTHGFKHFYV